MSHDIQPSHRKALTGLVIGVAMALALTLVQCRLVDDNVVGVKFGGHSAEDASACIAACAHAYGDSMRVESALHASNVKACGGDPACLADEAARFERVVERIRAGRRDCMNDCHHQGGGHGGR